MVRFAVCFFWKACSNCCFFARSVAEIHSGFHASCMETHYPLIFQLNFMTITLKWHIWPRLLWHEVALQCHASCLAGFAFHGFHAGTWWPKASSHRTHSRLNIFFSSPHNSKNSLLMIGRNESKMTYPPCRFQQSLQQWHAVKKKAYLALPLWELVQFRASLLAAPALPSAAENQVVMEQDTLPRQSFNVQIFRFY